MLDKLYGLLCLALALAAVGYIAQFIAFILSMAMSGKGL